MSKLYITISSLFAGIFLVASCSKFEPPLVPDDELLDGPVDGLSTAQTAQFLAGDLAFNDEIFTRENGLGPLFVTTSCGSCHAGDGKGHPFSTLIRFGQSAPGHNEFLNLGGPQLQNRALPGYAPEQIPKDATFSKFTPPANTGLGFLELVSDADIIAMSDSLDLDGDGISGVPNWIEVPSFVHPFQNALPNGNKYIHRFGKKASAYNLLEQTVNAYNQDIGITSTFKPKDPYSGLDLDPEVDNQTIHNVVFYLQTLKAPIPRMQEDPRVIQGKSLFIQIGCEKCHKQTLNTGYSPIEALSNKPFHPYTDLLLHDMGNALDDGYTEGSAETYEWRTPPLWGLGISPNSQGGNYFLMHDGRAKSIEEAIHLHGGEASASKSNFTKLDHDEQNALIQFLKSL